MEPIVCFVGDPIAGNPSQLATERALEASGLDWRVLSLNVVSSDVPIALDGFRVSGIHGALLDPSAQPHDISDDFYYRQEGRWLSKSLRDELLVDWCNDWLRNGDTSESSQNSDALTRSDAPTRSETPTRSGSHSIAAIEFIGTPREGLLNLFQRHSSFQADASTTDVPGVVAGSDESREASSNGARTIVVITRVPDDWQDSLDALDADPDGPLLAVIDDVGVDEETLRAHFPRVSNWVSREDVLAELIRRAVRHWTGHEVAASVVQEALEEYDSV